MTSLAITYSAGTLAPSSIALANAYSAQSLRITRVGLGVSLTAAGAGVLETLTTATRKIYTPPAIYLKDLPPLVQRWILDVSKVLNDGIEGGEVITEVKRTGESLTTAVTEAKEAAQQASASADSVAETAQTQAEEFTVLQSDILDLEQRLKVLEP